jgi:hypothetical protein
MVLEGSHTHLSEFIFCPYKDCSHFNIANPFDFSCYVDDKINIEGCLKNNKYG